MQTNIRSARYIGHLGKQDHDDTLALNAEAMPQLTSAPKRHARWPAFLVPAIVATPWSLLYLLYLYLRHK